MTNIKSVEILTNSEMIDESIQLYQNLKVDEAYSLIDLTMSEKDQYQVFLSYLSERTKEWIAGNNLIICSILKYNHQSDYIRALSYFGYKNILVETINFSENKNIYISILEPFFERFGQDEFIRLIEYLLLNNLNRINGPQNILAYKTVLLMSEAEKRDLLKTLIRIGVPIYKKRTVEMKENNLQGITIMESELDENFSFDTLGIDVWLEDYGLIFSELKRNEFENFFSKIEVAVLPKAKLYELLSLFIDTASEDSPGWELLINLVANSKHFDTSKHLDMKLQLIICLKLKKIGKTEQLNKFILVLKNQIQAFKNTLDEESEDFDGSLNILGNYFRTVSFLNGFEWDETQTIYDFLEIYLELSNNTLDTYMLKFFDLVTNNTEGFESRYQIYAKIKKNYTAIDYYFAIKESLDSKDLTQAESLYLELRNKTSLIDERHHYLMFKYAVDENNHLLFNNMCAILGESANKSSFLLTLNIKYYLNNANYVSVEKIVIDHYLIDHTIRDEEIVDLAREFPIGNLRNFEILLDKLKNYGYKIPSKAVSSLAEKLSRFNDIDYIEKLVKKYSDTVGDNIAFTEFQLLLCYIKNDNQKAARYTATTILSRQLPSQFRTHVSRLLERSNLRIDDEEILALQFEFGKSELESKIVRRQYKQTNATLLRNQIIVKNIKQMYKDQCQVCGQTLNTPLGQISEAAHIQGLGRPHFGPDELGNLLCLCPNHHKLLDNSGIYIKDNFEVVETVSGDVFSKLIVLSDHEIRRDCLAYQRNYCINSARRGLRKWDEISIDREFEN